MALAQQHDKRTIGLCLNPQDVQKIKEYTQNQSNKNFDRPKLCILFDTIKSVFGDKIFKGLLKFPVKSREAFSINSTSDHWVHKNNTFSVSDCSLNCNGNGQDVYIEDITLHFKKAPSIMNIFNKKQQEFLGKIGLDSSSFSIFRIQRSMDSSTKNSSFRYEILPFHKSWISSGGGQMFMFGFSANTKAIEMIPIFMDFRKKAAISTKDIPASIERVWLFAKDDLMSSNNVFHLTLDHDAKSRLNTIMVHSVTSKRFTVNVKCNMKLSPKFTIENMSNQCQIIGYKKMKITDTEDIWRSLLKQMQEEEDSDEYY
eukprot:423751_1